MAKKIYVGVGDKARNVKALYVGVNNVARKVKKAYVGVNNIARLCWENGPIGPTIPCSIPRMTSATAPSGTVTWSSTQAGNAQWDGWHAFRTSDNECWSPRSVMRNYPNPWLQYDFGYLVQPISISFRCKIQVNLTWYFLGSKDNSSWTTLQSFYISGFSYNTYSATFTTTDMYRYFKMSLTYAANCEAYFAKFYLNGLRY